MREVSGSSSPESGAPSAIDPISEMGRLYSDLADQKQTAEQELTEVEREQAAAIRLAKEPFAPRIGELKTAIEDIDRQQATSFGRTRLEELLQNSPPLYRASLELLIARFWPRDSIDGFIAQLGNMQPDNYLMAIIERQLKAITALEAKLRSAKGPQPVVVFGLRRMEERDEQAEWEGRDSRTGVFRTEVFGFCGVVDGTSLGIQAKEFLLPDQFGYKTQPTKIMLRILHANILQNLPHPSANQFDMAAADDGVVDVLLLAREEPDSQNQRLLIEWSKDNLEPNKNLHIAVGQEEIDALALDRYPLSERLKKNIQ